MDYELDRNDDEVLALKEFDDQESDALLEEIEKTWSPQFELLFRKGF
jgi:hypothetical protein